MRTRAAILGTLASIGVLAAGWEVGASALASTAVAETAPSTSTTTSQGSSTSGAAAGTSTDTSSGASTGSGSTTDTGTSTDTGSTGSGAADTGSTDTSTTAPAAAAPASTVADGTYTGTSESTRFGNVQVAVTISAGQITDVAALQLTDKENKSVQISNRAAPILRSEVLDAQSASVANVGGATYTSDAYLASLQSALDQAGF